MACKSDNLIYCMTCETCNLQYIGQTSGTLSNKFIVHFDKIQKFKFKIQIQKYLFRHVAANWENTFEKM